jgi:hypothetical protein
VRRRLTDALTGVAARSFPPSRRKDGWVVRDCAREAIDASGLRSLPRECVSLVGAGLRVRSGLATRDLRRAPWGEGLSALTLPLAAALLTVWVFGFVPRYDHWPLGEGWMLLLGGSLAAVVGAAVRSRWLTAVGALATFVAAASPHLGLGTTATLNTIPSFFDGGSAAVDFGAASLAPALLLAVGGLSLRRARPLSAWAVAGRLALGLTPATVALIVLLPAPEPRPTYGVISDAPGVVERVIVGPPYPMPWIWHAEALVNVLGIALAVALVVAWARARREPAAALASGLVLVSVAYPVAWLVSRNLAFALWMFDARAIGALAVLPLLLALMLMRRGARRDWPRPLVARAARRLSRTSAPPR